MIFCWRFFLGFYVARCCTLHCLTVHSGKHLYLSPWFPPGWLAQDVLHRIWILQGPRRIQEHEEIHEPDAQRLRDTLFRICEAQWRTQASKGYPGDMGWDALPDSFVLQEVHSWLCPLENHERRAAETSVSCFVQVKFHEVFGRCFFIFFYVLVELIIPPLLDSMHTHRILCLHKNKMNIDKSTIIPTDFNNLYTTRIILEFFLCFSLALLHKYSASLWEHIYQ